LVSGALLLGIAIDPIHTGAGRFYGVVDLPIQRDALGYPLAFASSVKGALKSLCARRNRCVKSNTEGRLACSDSKECKICCCLFGPEPGEGDKGAGKISVLDLIPFALPAPSSDLGYVYITSSVLLSRIYLALEALTFTQGTQSSGSQESEASYINYFKNFIEDLYKKSLTLKSGECLALGDAASRDRVAIGTSFLKVVSGKSKEGKQGDYTQYVNSIFEDLGGLARNLPNRLVVVSGNDGATLIERALIRLTRVSLKQDTKTVKAGPWTEEYLPYGTVFVSGLIVLPFTNEYCRGVVGDDPKEVMEKLVSTVFGAQQRRVFYVVVGGKETIGKGLIKFRMY